MTLSPRGWLEGLGRLVSLERSRPKPPERPELRVLSALPYALLLAATVLDLGGRGGFTGDALIDIALAAAAGAWMGGWVRFTPTGRSAGGMAFGFVVLVALGAALVIRAPVFGFYVWTGNLWVFRMLGGRWRIPGLVAIAVLTAISQDGGQLPGSSASAWLILAAFVLINLVATAAVARFVASLEEQKRRHEQSIVELTEANLKLESTLRENAGLHAQLIAQAREAGILDERQRMAREIHDTLAQGLTGIITQLQAADQTGLEEADRRRHFDAAAGLARESLSEARRSVQAMRPQPLASARLPEALAGVVARWSSLHGVPAELITTGHPRTVRVEIETALLRTAQEALANVAKHARADRVGLTLSYMEDMVTLDVRDDGAGFRSDELSSRAGGVTSNGHGHGDGDGYGLAAMRERMQALSGRLEIESEPGGGTAISAAVPTISAASVR